VPAGIEGRPADGIVAGRVREVDDDLDGRVAEQLIEMCETTDAMIVRERSRAGGIAVADADHFEIGM
jgi:hypothetical protein